MTASRALLAAALAAVLLAAPAGAAGPTVVELGVTGVVDPFLADHVVSGIEAAEREGAAAVLLTIDTPGGLDSAMREIVQAVLNSRVPVLCYVSPAGARAASAGTFILLACGVAAMAPATNVGAAHPVGVAGAIESRKAENDAAEYIVAIAERRGRNAAWAERAVRESVSASAEEALRLGVIDLIAEDVPTLLRELDGRTVEVAGGRTVTLDLTGATIERRGMGLGVGLLHRLLDPNLAFLAFWLGLALVAAEFFVPGGVLGTVGGVLLVLSIVAFGMLPVQLVGIVLLLAAVVFFVLELKHPGVGLPTVGGVVSLLAGGLVLFDPSVPSARVSLWVLLPVAAAMGAFSGFVVKTALRLRRRRAVSGADALLGREGRAVTALAPRGVVQVAAEDWTAVSTGGRIPRGARVRVVGIDGLKLRVERIEEEAAAVAAEEGRTS
ncbi:MAG TPA: nodulation protein NfeD [Actinomycetota bacterium]|nr:nodulation protein NfeD [Actinomycetota bacterium]